MSGSNPHPLLRKVFWKRLAIGNFEVLLFRLMVQVDVLQIGKCRKQF
jgi:hypothetical protein